MLGDSHWATGTTTGVGGGVTSAFLVMVTTALVSVATALKETLPEYVVAVVPVIDPETLVEVVYLYVSKLSIQRSVPKTDPNSDALVSSGLTETTEEIGGGSRR
jgi:hypothetical protein